MKESALKTVSWLAVSYVLITGSACVEGVALKTAVLASLWACVIKTPVYWLHERVWHKQKKAS